MKFCVHVGYVWKSANIFHTPNDKGDPALCILYLFSQKIYTTKHYLQGHVIFMQLSSVLIFL